MIDLRSEAVAPLHPAVREALTNAPDGSDAYDEDPAVLALETRLKEMFGMGTALLVPTGRLANSLAMGMLSRPGTEALFDADAHVLSSEYGMTCRLWGIQTRTYPTPAGRLEQGSLDPLLHSMENTTVPTSVVGVEDTHTAHGGVVQSIPVLRAIAERVRQRGASFLCDGARLWYANVVQQVPWTAYGQIFDALTVSLVKGVGGPVGAAVLFREEVREEARTVRRMIGGAWVRPGPLAAAASAGIDHNVPLLGKDCSRAARLAAQLRAELADSRVVQETNVVMFDVPNSAHFFERCREEGVLLFRYTKTRMRVCFHRGVSDADTRAAGEVLVRAYAELTGIQKERGDAA
jgi:threonine aldolase